MLVLSQSHDFPSASEVTLKIMDEQKILITHDVTKTKKSKKKLCAYFMGCTWGLILFWNQISVLSFSLISKYGWHLNSIVVELLTKFPSGTHTYTYVSCLFLSLARLKNKTTTKKHMNRHLGLHLVWHWIGSCRMWLGKFKVCIIFPFLFSPFFLGLHLFLVYFLMSCFIYYHIRLWNIGLLIICWKLLLW